MLLSGAGIDGILICMKSQSNSNASCCVDVHQKLMVWLLVVSIRFYNGNQDSPRVCNVYGHHGEAMDANRNEVKAIRFSWHTTSFHTNTAVLTWMEQG